MLKSHKTIKFDLEYRGHNKIELNNTVDELDNLREQYELYYIENNSIRNIYNREQLVYIYEHITDVFYVDVHRTELNTVVDNLIDYLEDYFEIVE